MCENESSICEVCLSEGCDVEDTDSKYSCSATCMTLMHFTVLGERSMCRVQKLSIVQINQVQMQVADQRLGISNTQG